MAELVERLIASQSAVGKDIEKLIGQYKEEHPEKRTIQNLTARLESLNELWRNFDNTDGSIRSLIPMATGHAYFTSNYYQKVKQGYEKTAQEIQELIAYVNEESNPGNITTADAGEGPSTMESPAKKHVLVGDDERLKRSIRRQRTSLMALDSIINGIDTSPQPLQYYELKLECIEQYWAAVRQSNTEIIEAVDDPERFGYDLHKILEFEQKVQTAMITLRQKRDELKYTGANSTLSEVYSPRNQAFVKLPKVELPKFDGEYLKWQQFKDLYVQMVHNQNIADSQKMWYLKAHLVGEAEKIIRHLPLTNDNYAIAWDTLKRRFDNKRLLVNALINKLTSQPMVEDRSAVALRQLHDSTRECIDGLQNLGVAVQEHWDPIIMNILLKKVDASTHALYEQSLTSPRELQSVESFLVFIEKRFQALETLNGPKVKSNERASKPTVLTTSNTELKLACAMCNGSHAIYCCDAFLSLKVAERSAKARELKLCINCLKTGHFYNKCSAKGCAVCRKRHNTLLHFAKPSTKTVTNVQEDEIKPTLSTATNLAAQTKEVQSGYVFLGTAMVQVFDQNGQATVCRALLDSGSQLNFMTERLRKKLRLANTQVNLTISGIGDARSKVTDRVQVRIASLVGNSYASNIEVYVIKEIAANQPQYFIRTEHWEIPENVALADPEFNKPQKVDMLLGAELYGELIRYGQMKLNDGLPSLQNTTLGWIVLGKVTALDYNTPFCGITNLDLQNQLQKFWELEEWPQEIALSATDQKCEDFFEGTTFRDSTGRFIVSLPMLSDPRLIGESKDIAYKRFINIEKKLQRDPHVYEQYRTFMQEYIELGHMQEVGAEEIKSPHCFLPHHFVLKPSSSITKLRVVFDASAKTSNNISLNDLLLKGPKIQDDLFSILLRFRIRRYVFTADIVKMYRQILVAEEDRNMQLIMWRDRPDEAIRYYQLCTVTYGTKCASYLATKCLQKLGKDGAERYPLASSVMGDFYVDDIITGGDDLTAVIEMQNQVRHLLKEAGLPLRKWCANHPKLIENIPNQDLEIQLNFSEIEDHHIKTLGLVWHPVTDMFAVSSSDKTHKVITKGSVLSEISQIFDPLGLINPVVVKGKIFMQQLWKLELGWDDQLPFDLQSSWFKFREELSKLTTLRIPRHVRGDPSCSSLQLHAFADASEKAYGTAVYIRSRDGSGKVTVRLLCSRSRVAPVKQVTLPRLELCAAKLACQTVKHILSEIQFKFEEIWLWTDSEIVLAWIKKGPSSLKTYVANRVSSILETTSSEQWKHVSSHENPADIVSRGVFPTQLVGNALWFEGPDFLKQSKARWPRSVETEVCLVEEEKTTSFSLAVTAVTEHPMYAINHGNSFGKLRRVLAYVLRAIRLFRKAPRTQLFLSVDEVNTAERVILKELQQQYFKGDMKELSKNNSVVTTSKLKNLTPFLDHGLMRVGGRIQQSEISEETKHPIVVPGESPIARLLMTYLHTTNLHAGPSALIAIARQRYWIVKGRELARSVVSNCVMCTRLRPRLGTQQMGNLPAHRVREARPFLNCGVDFCGPVYTHFKLRGKRKEKTYLAVFVCFATKAIHLEVVSDLTTEGFLGALKRFIARRGICENIYCDNARNFVRAEGQLKEVEHIFEDPKSTERIAKTCAESRIQFHFIPPRSPHFGGLWEAAVKSTKTLLRKALVSIGPTYEELCTIACEVEAILNTRPLAPLSSDPNDLTPLTPAHFLTGEPVLNGISTHTDANISLRTRWALVSQVRRDFWNRWHLEYLTELQKRVKWTSTQPNVKEGMLVVVKEDNIPPLKWPMGRIVEVVTGADKKVRVVWVKTASGIYRRAIHTIAPLPVDIVEPNHEQNIGQASQVNIDDAIWPQQDSQTSPVSRKRKGSANMTSPLKAILLTLLMMPALSATTPMDGLVQVEEFNNNAGVYFESLGEGSLTSDSWHVLAYYDLKSYWATIKAASDAIQLLKKLCSVVHHNEHHIQVVEQYIHQLNGIRENNILLAERSHIQPIRRKRSPFDIIGNIANKLFGVLDSSYEEHMSETIAKVKDDENHLGKLIRSQTSIVETTINIIKKDEQQLRDQANSVNKSFHTVFDNIQNLNAELKEQKLIQTFHTMAIFTSSLLIECQNIQDAILASLSDSQHGKINPLIISISQLQEQARVIKNHLPEMKALPSYNGTIDPLLLYRTMDIHASRVKDYIIFGIEIPLITSNRFELFRIIPVPHMDGTNFIRIVPKAPYMMVNEYRDNFHLLTETEFHACKTLTRSHTLCQQYQPVIKFNPSNSICELHLFTERRTTPLCPRELIAASRIWIQLRTPNRWIFALKKEEDFDFLCSGRIVRKGLKGSGLLAMDAGCSMRSAEITLLPSIQGVTTEFHAKSFYPKVNVTIEEADPTTMLAFNPVHVTKHFEALTNLSSAIQKLKANIDSPGTSSHYLHSLSVSYTSTGCVAVMILCAFIYYCRKRGVSTLQRSNAHNAKDFTFEVV